ncbi:MAG: hypothetical protein LBR95_02740 [Azoarcus sp.]|jgi:hypothetical protein|nr:hypothetical protein [Azoarcus sp.]
MISQRPLSGASGVPDAPDAASEIFSASQAFGALLAAPVGTVFFSDGVLGQTSARDGAPIPTESSESASGAEFACDAPKMQHISSKNPRARDFRPKPCKMILVKTKYGNRVDRLIESPDSTRTTAENPPCLA